MHYYSGRYYVSLECWVKLRQSIDDPKFSVHITVTEFTNSQLNADRNIVGNKFKYLGELCIEFAYNNAFQEFYYSRSVGLESMLPEVI